MLPCGPLPIQLRDYIEGAGVPSTKIAKAAASWTLAGFLSWLLSLVLADLILAVAGVLTARPLEEAAG